MPHFRQAYGTVGGVFRARSRLLGIFGDAVCGEGDEPYATTHSRFGGGAGPIPNRCVRTPPSSSDVPSGVSGTDNNSSRTSVHRQQGQQRRQDEERTTFGTVGRGFSPYHDEWPCSECAPHTRNTRSEENLFVVVIKRETRDGHAETGPTRQSPTQRAFKTSVHGSASDQQVPFARQRSTTSFTSLILDFLVSLDWCLYEPIDHFNRADAATCAHYSSVFIFLPVADYGPAIP